jgi:alpha-tubulin suppressor-like RCC1 family protein
LITASGALYCTGSDSNGQLGLGGAGSDLANPSFAALQVDALHLGTASRGFTSLAISPDDAFWVWGDNNAGQLGLGDQEDRNLPTCLALDGQSCPLNPNP